MFQVSFWGYGHICLHASQSVGGGKMVNLFLWVPDVWSERRRRDDIRAILHRGAFKLARQGRSHTSRWDIRRFLALPFMVLFCVAHVICRSF